MTAGTLGSNPNRIDRYFNMKNISFTKYYNLSTFEKKIKNGDVVIISFWNNNPLTQGLHTVTFFQVSNFFVVLNYNDKSSTVDIFYSIADIVKDRNKYIVSYIIHRT